MLKVRKGKCEYCSEENVPVVCSKQFLFYCEKCVKKVIKDSEDALKEIEKYNESL